MHPARATADSIYSPSELSRIELEKVPRHIALIMDGNRTWARNRGYPSTAGYRRGAERLDHTVRAAVELGVTTITAYSFSTENWKRPFREIGAIMEILESYLIEKRDRLIREGVRLCAIGNAEQLPKGVARALRETVEATKGGETIDLVLAIDYGGRDELCRSVRKIAEKLRAGTIRGEEITETLIEDHLDTSRWPDPDCVIRTGGKSRMSNFLPWQTVYSEILVTDVLWPDFSEKELLSTIDAFQKRDRRFGK